MGVAMTGEPERTPERASRSWIAWGLLSLALGVGVLAALLPRSGGGDGAASAMASPTPQDSPGISSSSGASPTPSATPLSSPTSGPSPEVGTLSGATGASVDEDAAVADATKVLEEFVSLVDEVTRDVGSDTAGIDALAVGFVRGEVDARAAEQSQSGVRQIGSTVIVSVTPIDVDTQSDPATVTLAVCLDSSNVDVLDSRGRSLKDRLGRNEKTLNYYGLQQTPDGWRLATHEFPDDPTC